METNSRASRLAPRQSCPSQQADSSQPELGSSQGVPEEISGIQIPKVLVFFQSPLLIKYQLRKMWENMGKYGKMWENVGKCGKIWETIWNWEPQFLDIMVVDGMLWFIKAPSSQACYGLSEIGFTTHEMTTGTSAPGDTADT